MNAQVFRHLSGLITSLPAASFTASSASYIAASFAYAYPADRALFKHISQVYPGGGRVTQGVRFVSALSRAGMFEAEAFRKVAEDVVAQPPGELAACNVNCIPTS
jgi:hypothetical protein